VTIAAGVGKELASLLFDPQTAGGLLISIASTRAEELLERLQENYHDAAVIGRVRARGPHLIVVE
jgi:selenide,water dikinase